ncbi:S-adenosyl-L-methionine-dependent methyltransferase [Pyronema domesticum]|nr:S-adenosyl-L-methionine-dependent methyltransferase [Pyronema domesticum]
MIEVDPSLLTDPDNDYYSSDNDTSTESITSSIQQYIYENGRRYHAYYGTEKWHMPTDEVEQERLDLSHEIFRTAWRGNLHEAPLHEPQRILDIGTGTGIWAIDMADRYPMAMVIGTDLSPIQPSFIPNNCRFEVDDVMQEWTFQDNCFDFIHGRNIASGISDWNHLASEMMRSTAPGGYVELCETSIGTVHCDDGTMKPDHSVVIFGHHLRDALTKIGRPQPDHQFMANVLIQAGYEDVKMLSAKEPIEPWPKDPQLKKVGAMNLLNAETGYESHGMAVFTRVLAMDSEKARQLCREATEASRNKNYHIYGENYSVYGRKPVR